MIEALVMKKATGQKRVFKILEFAIMPVAIHAFSWGLSSEDNALVRTVLDLELVNNIGRYTAVATRYGK